MAPHEGVQRFEGRVLKYWSLKFTSLLLLDSLEECFHELLTETRIDGEALYDSCVLVSGHAAYFISRQVLEKRDSGNVVHHTPHDMMNIFALETSAYHTLPFLGHVLTVRIISKLSFNKLIRFNIIFGILIARLKNFLISHVSTSLSSFAFSELRLGSEADIHLTEVYEPEVSR